MGYDAISHMHAIFLLMWCFVEQLLTNTASGCIVYTHRSIKCGPLYNLPYSSLPGVNLGHNDRTKAPLWVVAFPPTLILHTICR